MLLATMGQRFQPKWGAMPWCLVEVIPGLLESNASAGKYKTNIKPCDLHQFPVCRPTCRNGA